MDAFPTIAIPANGAHMNFPEPLLHEFKNVNELAPMTPGSIAR
jgi:hypothetical protein